MATAVQPDIAIRSRSAAARGRYIEATEKVARAGDVSDPYSILVGSVAWLELFYISALTWEFIREHDIRSFEQLRARANDVDLHVRAAFPDVVAAMKDIERVLGDLKTPDTASLDWGSIEWSQMVRSFDAVAAECPIERLENLGRALDQPALAHRARSAYDALRAFVRRHHPDRADVMRIVGEQYQRGNMRLHDVAKLLGTSTSDAVFELEHDGFGRTIPNFELDDLERAEIYARLREARLSSASGAIDQDLVERDVIASERIEGVDARAWIRHR